MDTPRTYANLTEIALDIARLVDRIADADYSDVVEMDRPSHAVRAINSPLHVTGFTVDVLDNLATLLQSVDK